MNERFYLLEIQLVDIEPAIWRRFVVPASITRDRLHDVIQIVMGWTDSHLHEFTIGKKRYTEYPESKEDGLECGRYRLGDLMKQKGRTFRYLNDLGGLPGYDEFCRVVKDPNHEEHERYMEWSGGDYDSERFDADVVNWELMKYLRWSRDRYQSWEKVE